MIDNGVFVKDSDVSQKVVEIFGLNKFFGKLHILKDINLSVESGEMLVIVGPSGSGKSTLCRTINRLETIDSGTIKIAGKLIPSEEKDLAMLRTQVGMVFQSFNLFNHKTVLENVCLGPVHVKKVSKNVASAHAMELLAQMGVDSQSNKLPFQLSGGQQQRVAIARALAMEPQIMIFDEATSALDPEMTSEILNIMSDLAKKGMTMIVITHEMGFARKAADQIVFMSDGVVLEKSVPEKFFSKPETDRAKSFLSKILSY